MPKYLFLTSYNAEGTRGLLKEGGSKRRKVAEDVAKAAGGRLEAFYFAFGEFDACAILDLPDGAGVAAASLAVNASGAVTNKTIVLMTAEEMDAAVKKAPQYRPPGGK